MLHLLFGDWRMDLKLLQEVLHRYDNDDSLKVYPSQNVISLVTLNLTTE